MATSTLSFSGSFSSPPEAGTESFGPYQFSNSSSPANATSLPLSTGNNTVVISDLANWVGIIMEPGNSVPVTFKEVAGDAGSVIALNGFIYFAPSAGSGRSFVLSVPNPSTVRMLQG